MSFQHQKSAPVQRRNHNEVYNERRRKVKSDADSARIQREAAAGFQTHPIQVRTKSGRFGQFIAQATDGNEKVAMLDIGGDDALSIRKMDSFKLVNDDDKQHLNLATSEIKALRGEHPNMKTISFEPNSKSQWRAAVGFGADPEDWRITKCDKEGQFYKKGVRVGYRIHQVNGHICNKRNQDRVRKWLRKAKKCDITFEKGSKEDLKQYSKKHSKEENGGGSRAKKKTMEPVE